MLPYAGPMVGLRRCQSIVECSNGRDGWNTMVARSQRLQLRHRPIVFFSATRQAVSQNAKAFILLYRNLRHRLAMIVGGRNLSFCPIQNQRHVSLHPALLISGNCAMVGRTQSPSALQARCTSQELKIIAALGPGRKTASVRRAKKNVKQDNRSSLRSKVAHCFLFFQPKCCRSNLKPRCLV